LRTGGQKRKKEKHFSFSVIRRGETSSGRNGLPDQHYFRRKGRNDKNRGGFTAKSEEKKRSHPLLLYLTGRRKVSDKKKASFVGRLKPGGSTPLKKKEYCYKKDRNSHMVFLTGGGEGYPLRGKNVRYRRPKERGEESIVRKWVKG